MSLTVPPKRTLQHKKRQAEHHRHSHRYVSAYWPYLPMILIVVAGIGLNSLLNQHLQSLKNQSSLTSASLLNVTNQDRSKNDEAALSLSSQLNSAAQAKAEDMASANYWSPSSPNGKTPQSFITSSGYAYQTAAENLAYGLSSANATAAAWMSSQDHRTNMLDSSFSNVGFGIAKSSNYLGQGPKTIVVADYAQPLNPLAAAQPSSPQMYAASYQAVSRLQIFSSSTATPVILGIIVLSSLAMALFIWRHGRRFRHLVFQGESYVLTHPWLDIGVVLFCTASVLLTRTVGGIS